MGPVEHSHILTQGQHKHLRNNPLNWLVLGSRCGCHRLWENNKRAFAQRYPEAWAEKLRRMKELHPQAYAFFCLKFSALVP